MTTHSAPRQTRKYRRVRREIEVEAFYHEAQRRQAEIAIAVALRERVADGIAPIDPAYLVTLLKAEPARGWAELAKLTPAQLINQAIEVAVFLEGRGRAMLWGDVLDLFERGIAEAGK